MVQLELLSLLVLEEIFSRLISMEKMFISTQLYNREMNRFPSHITISEPESAQSHRDFHHANSFNLSKSIYGVKFVR